MQKLYARNIDANPSARQAEVELLATYALTSPDLIPVYQAHARKWQEVLAHSGIQVPVFVVLDIGVLLHRPDSWLPYWTRTAPEQIEPEEWQLYLQRYWSGIKIVQHVLQRNSMIRSASLREELISEKAATYGVLCFLYFLDWVIEGKPATDADKELASLRKDFEQRVSKIYKQASNSRIGQQYERLFTKIVDKEYVAARNRLAKDFSLIDEFTDSANLTTAIWHLKQELAGLQRDTASENENMIQLDGQIVRKYCANFPFMYPQQIFQQVDARAAKGSVIPARSLHNQAFEEISPFGSSINPTELMYLSDPDTEDYFWSRWAEGSLLKFDANTPQEQPAEFQINYVVPALAEMDLYTTIEDQQSLGAYAKYLCLLIWHDYIQMYITAGRNESYDFYFSLHLPRYEEEEWKEKAYLLQVEDQWVQHDRPYMLQFEWEAEGSSASENRWEVFHKNPIEGWRTQTQVSSESVVSSFQLGGNNQRWLIFLPESMLYGEDIEKDTYGEEIAVTPASALHRLLSRGNRRYEHAIVIGLGNTYLYSLHYAYKIRLLPMNPNTPAKRSQQEKFIREILADHFMNQILIPTAS